MARAAVASVSFVRKRQRTARIAFPWWLVLPVGTCLCGLLFADVWVRTERTNRGYTLNELRQKRINLVQEANQLALEKVKLEAPERIERMARDMGLGPQPPWQVIAIETPQPHRKPTFAESSAARLPGTAGG